MPPLLFIGHPFGWMTQASNYKQSNFMADVEKSLTSSLPEELERIAERIRREPYRIFTNNCYHKSWKFLKKAAELGIKAKMCPVIGMAVARLPFLGWRMKIPVLHCWVEVEGKRIEISHPLGEKSVWEIIPGDVKPLIAVRFGLRNIRPS